MDDNGDVSIKAVKCTSSESEIGVPVDDKTDRTVMKDTIGDYHMNGLFNPKNGKLIFEKKYIRGTGNSKKNSGDTVRIRLQWDDTKNDFFGWFYVHIKQNEGAGIYSIKLSTSTSKKLSLMESNGI